MGIARSRSQRNSKSSLGSCSSQLRNEAAAAPRGASSSSSGAPVLPAEVHSSRYQRRVLQLAAQACEAPIPKHLEQTLRECIAFCYGVTTDWAPHVRVTVFADNPSEHQTNVPVYETLLCAWGVPGFVQSRVSCRPIQGTDVEGGQIRPSPFWQRTVQPESPTAKPVPYFVLIHQLLHFFVQMDSEDARKQLLINLLLQLHEACFNCIGRHKEVFEYCIYDLLDAEDVEQRRALFAHPESSLSNSDAEVEAARRAVRRFASHFMDQQKRAALHAAILSPLKFLFQKRYEVFENIDSHGTSFWVAVLTKVFFPGLEMPFESIVGMDGGWQWGAVDFLPLMREGDAKEALLRFSDTDSLGRDWRLLAKGLRPPAREPRRFAALPLPSLRGFSQALEQASQHNRLRASLAPYAARFAKFMEMPVILRRCAIAASSSTTWDTVLGPALARLSAEALGESQATDEVRLLLLGNCLDAGAMEVNTEAMRLLLQTADVPWAKSAQ